MPLENPSVAPSEPENEKPNHALVLKAVGAGFVILVLAVGLARVFFSLVTATSPQFVRWTTSLDLDRVAAVRAELPTLAAKDAPIGFMLGPSTMYYGFHPEVFDAGLAEQGITLESYNIAALGNISETDALLVHRIGDAYAAAGKRPALMMLQFGPLSLSTAFLDGRTRPHLRKKAMLSTTEEIGRMFFRDPHLATELATLRFYGGTAAADSNLLIGRRVFRPRPWWPGPPSPPPSAWEQQSGRVNQGYAQILGKFDVPTRGIFNPTFGNDVAEYDRMAALAFGPEAIEEQSKYWSAPAFVDVEVAPGRVENFIEAVTEAQRIADHVVVVIPPVCDLIHFSPIGQANLEKALDTVRSATGVQVVDLSARPEFVQADFVDFTHLKYNTGAPKFSRMLAEAVGPLVRDAKR